MVWQWQDKQTHKYWQKRNEGGKTQTHRSHTCGWSHRQQEVLWVIRTNETVYLLTVRKIETGTYKCAHTHLADSFWHTAQLHACIFALWLQFQPNFDSGPRWALTLWYGGDGKAGIRDLNRGKKKQPNLALAHEIRAPSAYHRTNNHQTRSPWYATVINSNKRMNNSTC